MAYIGREPQIGNYQVCDAISVVNAQAAYTMQVNSVNVLPESVNHMIVSLNGVIQNPGGDNPSYTISGATITFSSNLATGDSIDFIYLLGNVLDLGTPSDDTVTGAKIVDNAINSEHYTDGSIDLAHLSADSVDGSKIVDNAINSEHYTDGSIDTAHIADGQVTTAKLATAVFTAATDIGAAIVDADLFLMDDGAGGTIRKTTAARIKTYAGGDNKPAFLAEPAVAQSSISDDTLTKVSFTEVLDTASAYNGSRFTPGVAGYYQVNAIVEVADSTDNGYGAILVIYKNGALEPSIYNEWDGNAQIARARLSASGVVYLDADDYIEVYASFNTADSGDAQIGTEGQFSAYKLIT